MMEAFPPAFPDDAIAATPADCLRLLARGAQAGIDGVLVTLVGIEGRSSRSIGTQMAVLADGRSIGSFSGGCVERAVIEEAREVLVQGTPRTVRFGAGSPYIDVRLPCGGGIDLLFTPAPSAEQIDAALATLERRRCATIDLGGWRQTYRPRPRLVALGHGEDLAALARLARRFGLAVEAFAPEGDPHRDPDIAPLTLRTRLPDISGDAWTAFVFAFHDRDWEEFLLPQALALPGYYHGAVGSRATHRARCEALARAGVPAHRIDALRGTIGLIPGARDPATLALSILAEIVQDYNACAGAPDWMASAPALPAYHGA
ncbi:XdhC family protein [Novosphingobium olei]|uniref:XdhC family protein n=1 Tax=Novosphingobium olei TaxID=2728851 RepID=UPI003087581E|nr:XdhC family protein [Novosphingobium olei]